MYSYIACYELPLSRFVRLALLPVTEFLFSLKPTVYIQYIFCADLIDRAVYGVGLQPFAFCGCGFKSLRRHECVSPVIVVCCQIEVSASSWSLVQRIPTECDVSEYDLETREKKKILWLLTGFKILKWMQAKAPEVLSFACISWTLTFNEIKFCSLWVANCSPCLSTR